ncbi:hypothetical protein ACL9RF_11470 [Sphingobacterium sp. Mn56C]|uniref:hypothetical protein n=1 Tax=Sphingobacterium sp. Mn56C TaxID=3395261 RepID=UPI003BE8BA22
MFKFWILFSSPIICNHNSPRTQQPYSNSSTNTQGDRETVAIRILARMKAKEVGRISESAPSAWIFAWVNTCR